MACYSPLNAFKTTTPNKNGKFPIVFKEEGTLGARPVTIPCGKCIGCKIDKSREWTIRCINELTVHDSNCFITLTYDNVHVPENQSIDIKDFQDFMRELRRKYAPKKIRYFACAEYGEQGDRPHFHAILFGIKFDDSLDYVINGKKLWSSGELSKIWTKGFNTVGEATSESISYVAGYVSKKIQREMENEGFVNIESGEDDIWFRKREVVMMSRRPGIGYMWFKRYHKSIMKDDFLINEGFQFKVPRYYDKLHEAIDKGNHDLVKYNREYGYARQRFKNKEEKDTKRMRTKERLQLRKLKLKTRSYENESKTVRNI